MDAYAEGGRPRFFLTERGEAPQVPDFDGRGPRVCSIADRWLADSGKEYWLVDVDPPVSGWGTDGSQLVLACRHGGVALGDVFEGDLVRVHVVMIDGWDRFKTDIATGTAESHYWGEITADRAAIPRIRPSATPGGTT